MRKFVPLVCSLAVAFAASTVCARGMGGCRACDNNAQANTQPAAAVPSTATPTDATATAMTTPLSPEQIAASRDVKTDASASRAAAVACDGCSKKNIAQQSSNLDLARKVALGRRAFRAERNLDKQNASIVKN